MRILRNKIIDFYRKTRTKQSEEEASVRKEVSIDQFLMNQEDGFQKRNRNPGRSSRMKW